jgi:DNA ligase-1
VKNHMAPLMATDAVPELIRYPVLASVKVDGMRVLIRDGVALSRTLKPIPNEYFQAYIKKYATYLEGMDGEVVVGPENAPDVMQKTQSGMKRKHGEPDFTLLVFDLWNSPLVYRERDLQLGAKVVVARAAGAHWLERLGQFQINTEEELTQFETEALQTGFEGVMIRDAAAHYKFGRSTAKEGILLKVKRFTDGEAEVIGVEEQMHNDNEATRDELGRTKRSTSKRGLRPAGVLGAFIVRDRASGQVFSVGSGLTAAQRRFYWDRREDVIGQMLKYKSFTATGVKDAPRFPVFIGWRDPIDIGDPE